MWSVLSIIFLLLVLTLVFSFPSVQTAMAKYAVEWVNEEYDIDISVEKVRYVFPDELVLNDVYLEDHHQDTMVYASVIDVHFHGFNSLSNTAYSNGVTVDDLKFYWVKHPGDSIYNFDRFISSFNSGDTAKGKPFNLRIADIEVNNGVYRYENLNCPSCYRFFLRDLQCEVEAFDLHGSYLDLEVEFLRANDEYSVDIRELTTYFEYEKDHIGFDGLKFETGGSTFEGDVSLNYEQVPDFRDFVNKIRLIGNIEEAHISSWEIRRFSEQFPDFGKFDISGRVDGVVNDMKLEDVVVNLGTNTHLESQLELKHTTSLDRIYVKALGLELQTNPDDAQFIYGLFTDTLLPKELLALGVLEVEADFDGSLDNFKTKGELRTEVGVVQADVYLNVPEGERQSDYKGDIKLLNFNLGKVIDESSLGMVSTELSLDGRGFDPTTMNTWIKGEVSQLQFRDYSYSGINIDGAFSNGIFEGDLNIADPNLELDFSGNAGFEKDTSKYNFAVVIDYANLFELGLIPEEDSISVVTGEVDIDFVALNYDRWAGDVIIHNSTYETYDNFHFFRDIKVHSQGWGEDRYLELRSDILDVTLQGNYTMEGIVAAMQSQLGQYVKTLDPVAPPENQEFAFEVDIKNSQILTDVLISDLYIEQGSHVEGEYSSDSSMFALAVSSPEIDYRKMRVRGIDLDYLGSPGSSVLGFNVGNFHYQSLDIDSINLGNFYYQDTLFYDLNWVLRDSIDSRTNLLGYAIQEDTSVFKFGIYESDFNISLQQFKIEGNNQIVLDTSGVHIENLVIRDGEEAVYVNGNISDKPYEILRLNLQGFGMDILNYIIGSDDARFSGDLGGSILLTELLTKPKFAANLAVDSLRMNQHYLGDFRLNSDWTVTNDTINLEAALNKGQLVTFKGNGYYQPDSLGAMAFDLNFNRFALATFSPFLEDLAENIRGYAKGDIAVTGTTGSPRVNGELTLPQAGFTVSLLQSDYNFVNTPTVKITPTVISFPGLKVRDTQFGTEGSVVGNIKHDNFYDFDLDLHIKADELLVLNTNSDSEDPYYGRAFVKGDINILGPIDEILITADVVSAGNTEIFLPIDGATEVDQTGFVTFVDHSEKDMVSVIESTPVVMNLNKGVTIDFNVEVDRNADVAIIVDSDVGNQLESKGVGNIRMIMKPYSDLEMYGTYTVIEGYYNFVLPVLSQSLLTRRFDVLRGGSVTWDGDPLGALISLTARYTTKADPGALLSGLSSGGPTLTILDLYLSGELMDPDIDFDISAPRAPTTVQSALSNQVASQDNLYTQVFSILALNRFASAEGLNLSNAGRSLGFSALTNQAANYINMLTGGEYQVSLDYQAPSDDASVIQNQQREVEVGVSKRFLDNRFTISTSLGVAVDRQPDQRQFASDAEIEYNITEDGRFRAKAFNRPVQDQYNFGQQNYQQGIGVFYRRDFNKIGDLWRNEKKNKEAVREEDENLSDGDLSGPPSSEDEDR